MSARSSNLDLAIVVGLVVLFAYGCCDVLPLVLH